MGFASWVRKIPWRREWQPTSTFLPRESHGQRSLAGYGPWSHKESDTTERLTLSNHWYPQTYMQRRWFLYFSSNWFPNGPGSLRPLLLGLHPQILEAIQHALGLECWFCHFLTLESHTSPFSSLSLSDPICPVESQLGTWERLDKRRSRSLASSIQAFPVPVHSPCWEGPLPPHYTATPRLPSVHFTVYVAPRWVLSPRAPNSFRRRA